MKVALAEYVWPAIATGLLALCTWGTKNLADWLSSSAKLRRFAIAGRIAQDVVAKLGPDIKAAFAANKPWATIRAIAISDLEAQLRLAVPEVLAEINLGHFIDVELAKLFPQSTAPAASTAASTVPTVASVPTQPAPGPA